MAECLILPLNHFIKSIQNVGEIAFIKAKAAFNLDAVGMWFRAKNEINSYAINTFFIGQYHVQLMNIALIVKRLDLLLINKRLMKS